MDPRVHTHAEILVDWSARIEPGDDVVVRVADGAEPLAEAVAAELAKREANPVWMFGSGDIQRAYLRQYPEADFAEDPAHELALFEHADAYLRLGGGTNTAATADVPGDVRSAARTAKAGIREARYETKWVSTVHPTPALAQQASMATAEYRDFVYGAIDRDWAELAEEMAQLKAALDARDRVRIETPNTDISMRIDGRTAVNSAASVAYDSHNLPSGEVFTAPYGTTGTVTFDVPMTIRGKPVRDVTLEFEDGEVVDYDADTGRDVIGEVLATDPGANRLGELGIGMNREIDRFTDNILFDEKMGDTFHLALGRAYDACLPAGETGNESAVHVDMIADVSSEATMTIDGEVIQRDGWFRWEPEFES